MARRDGSAAVPKAPARGRNTRAGRTTSPTRKSAIQSRKRRASPSPPTQPIKRRQVVKKTEAAPAGPAHITGANRRAVPVEINIIPGIPVHERPSFQLFCWGGSDSGQLGMGAAALVDDVSKPRRNREVDGLIEEGAFGESSAGLEAVAAGGLHSVLIDEKGTVWTCGTNDNAELGRPTIITTDSTGAEVVVDKATSRPFHVPVAIQSLVDDGFRAVRVAAGDCISAVISDKGELRAWGTYRSFDGPFGFSESTFKQDAPVPLASVARFRFSSIAAGDNHLVMLTTAGEVYAAGACEEMQLARRIPKRFLIRATVPSKVVLGKRSRKAVVVGAAADCSFAVDDDGTVWAWGLNAHGQTGTGVDLAVHSQDRLVGSPKPVKGLSKDELGGATIVQIAGGSKHTLFLTSDGLVFACGYCVNGELGLPEDHPALTGRGDQDFVPEPVLVPFPHADDPVVQIACASHNSLAVTRHGALYSWGSDTTGQTGVGSSGPVWTPTAIVRRDGGSWAAKVVSCGGQHSLALLQKKT